MGSLEVTEELGGRGAVAPRVSLKDITDAIDREHYFTAGAAVVALGQPSVIDDPLGLLTICILVMRNGFVVIGKSAPASPANFDADKGRTFAREDAIRQLWPLMGFALRDRLHGDAEDARLLALPYDEAANLRRRADGETLARLNRLAIAVDVSGDEPRAA